MLRFVAIVLLILAVPGTLAQAITWPTLTVSAGALRATSGYDEQGDRSDAFATVTATAYRLGVEAPILHGEKQTLSLGGRIALASYGLGFDSGNQIGGDVQIQNLDLYGRLGTERASARVGVSLNLGPDEYDLSGGGDRFFINSDGQHAIVGQLRGEIPFRAARLFAQADASLTFPMSSHVLSVDTSFPPEAGVTPYGVTVDNGDLFGAQVGAEAPVGPVALGLALFYASRTGGYIEYVDGLPPDFPAGFPSTLPLRTGYVFAFGVIPSVEYRAPGGAVTLRAEGSFSDLYSMENVPVGITLVGKGGPATRPAVTLSVGVGL